VRLFPLADSEGVCMRRRRDSGRHHGPTRDGSWGPVAGVDWLWLWHAV